MKNFINLGRKLRERMTRNSFARFLILNYVADWDRYILDNGDLRNSRIFGKIHFFLYGADEGRALYYNPRIENPMSLLTPAGQNFERSDFGSGRSADGGVTLMRVLHGS